MTEETAVIDVDVDAARADVASAVSEALRPQAELVSSRLLAVEKAQDALQKAIESAMTSLNSVPPAKETIDVRTLQNARDRIIQLQARAKSASRTLQRIDARLTRLESDK